MALRHNYSNESFVDRNTTPADTEGFGEDAFLPLRIIMYAPHVHKNNRETRKHTHLILKTGDPGFHGHLGFGTDTASPTDWRVLINVHRIFINLIFSVVF